MNLHMGGRLTSFNTTCLSPLHYPLPSRLHNPLLPCCAGPRAGAYSTFVISKSGDVVAWGLNNSCQLGIDKGDEQNNLMWEPSKVR